MLGCERCLAEVTRKLVVRAWIYAGFVLVEACCSAKRSSPNIFALFLGFAISSVSSSWRRTLSLTVEKSHSGLKTISIALTFVNVYRSVYSGLSKVDDYEAAAVSAPTASISTGVLTLICSACGPEASCSARVA